MQRFILGLAIVLATAIPARAQLDGFAQPGAGFSYRGQSNGLEWKNAMGIGVYDGFTYGSYGVLTTDEGSAGFDWSGPALFQNNAGIYRMGPHRLDHRARTDAGYFTSCEPSPQFLYTQDVCAWGFMFEEVPIQTNGLGGTQTYDIDAKSDVSIAQMSAYSDSFDNGSFENLIYQPKGLGGPFSTRLIDPPVNEAIQYFNNSIQAADAGTIINNNVRMLAYFGPNPTTNSNCDQYGDCQWTPPSGYTSNWGAPQTSSAFWTRPGDVVPSNLFIYGNSVTMEGIMEAKVGHAVLPANEGAPVMTQSQSCMGWVGSIIGRLNGSPSYIFISRASQDIYYLDYGCQASGLNCSATKLYDWRVAGALCSSGELTSAALLTSTQKASADLTARMMDIERSYAPSTARLEALSDPGAHVSPMYLSNDSDGLRWHVGIVGPGVTRDGLLAPGRPSKAMQMAIGREFTANGATAPVVVEPGYMMTTGAAPGEAMGGVGNERN